LGLFKNKQIWITADTRFSLCHSSSTIICWFLISAYAIAAVFPTAGLWIRNTTFGYVQVFQTKIHISLLLLLLAKLMFNAELGVKTSHLKSLVQKTGVGRRAHRQSCHPH